MHEEAAHAAKARATSLRKQRTELLHDATLNAHTARVLEDDAHNATWMGGVLDGSGQDDRLRLSPTRHLDEYHLGSMSGIDTVAAFQGELDAHTRAVDKVIEQI